MPVVPATLAGMSRPEGYSSITCKILSFQSGEKESIWESLGGDTDLGSSIPKPQQAFKNGEYKKCFQFILRT